MSICPINIARKTPVFTIKQWQNLVAKIDGICLLKSEKEKSLIEQMPALRKPLQSHAVIHILQLSSRKF